MTVIYDKQANLVDPREINLCFYTNPTSLAIVGYRTTVDPAIVSDKLNPGSPPAKIQIAEIGGNILGVWAEDYGTGTDDAKVWHKANMPASAPAPIIVYDRTPLGDDEDAEDDDHKRHVTDITGEKGHVMHLLFAGASTPSGFTLESGSGEEFNNVFPVGASEGLGANDDEPIYDVSLVSCGISLPKRLYDSSSYRTLGQHYHDLDEVYKQGVSESCVPPYHMLKCIRSNLIKAMIPKDAIIIFDGDVPQGFTRYSSADNKYIRTGGAVGETGGASTRRVLVQAWTNAIHRSGYQAEDVTYYGYATATQHYHFFEAYTGAINNDPPYINVVLGKANGDLNYIPAGAIIMFDSVPPEDDWDVINFDGRLLVGKNTYGGIGGAAKRTPTNAIANCNTEGQYNYRYITNGSYACKYTHQHEMEISVGEISTYPKCRQVIFAKAKHDITEDGPEACVIQSNITPTSGYYSFEILESNSGRHVVILNKGNDVGELYCSFAGDIGSGVRAYYGKSADGGKTWTVSRIDDTWNGVQRETDLVADKNNNIHFVWAEYGESGRRKIKYRTLSEAGSLGGVETVSTSGDDYYQTAPCIQINPDGETVGVVWTGEGWGSDTSKRDIAYRERTASSWGSEEHITTTASDNYSSPSLDFDGNGKPHIVAYNSTKNGYYYYKTTSWQGPEQVNSADNNDLNWLSNIVIDKDDNVHIAYTTYLTTGYDVKYKTRTSAGWGSTEMVTEAAGVYSYVAPQIQLDENGVVYLTYTKQKYVGTPRSLMSLVYKTRNGSWSSETALMSSTARVYAYGQLLWSRLPIKSGVYQSKPKQYVAVIYVATSPDDYSIGDVEFKSMPLTVLGSIDDDGADPVTVTTFKSKRRGVICSSKINSPIASPALIS
jgi:hypothetical protein